MQKVIMHFKLSGWRVSDSILDIQTATDYSTDMFNFFFLNLCRFIIKYSLCIVCGLNGF